MALKLCPLSIKYRTFLWKNHAQNVHQKLVPDSFLILLNNPKQPFHARNSFQNGQNCQKQKGSRTSDQSLLRLQNKFKNIPLFVIYYLTKFGDVI